MKRPYDNLSSRAERRSVVENDGRVRVGFAYSELAQSESEISRGRFTTQEKSNVIGSGPVTYPALPEESPWHCDPVPPEAPLGVDLGAAPIVGEPHEIQESLLALGDAGAPSGQPDGDGRRFAGAGPSSALPAAPSLPRKRRTRR
jgi:hypothetical protein